MLQSKCYSKLLFLMKSQQRLWGELRHMSELLWEGMVRKGVRTPCCALLSAGIFGKSWEYEKRVGKITLNLCNISVSKHSLINSEIEVHICNTNRHTWSRWLKGKFKRLPMWWTLCRWLHLPMSSNLHSIPRRGMKNVPLRRTLALTPLAGFKWSSNCVK